MAPRGGTKDCVLGGVGHQVEGYCLDSVDLFRSYKDL